MNLFMSKDELNRWLDRLLRERILVAPVQVQGLTLFQPVSKVEEIALDFGNTTLSPKEWFLNLLRPCSQCRVTMGSLSWSQLQ